MGPYLWLHAHRVSQESGRRCMEYTREYKTRLIAVTAFQLDSSEPFHQIHNDLSMFCAEKVSHG